MLYKGMYLTLFRAITKAIHELSQHNYANAEAILVSAQQDAEEQYISSADELS